MRNARPPAEPGAAAAPPTAVSRALRVAGRLRGGPLGGSPIREIMKLADPDNLVAMGLDPDEVISFAGGWVGHEAPPALRAAYEDAASDPHLFHELGAYSPTRGLPRTRNALLAMDRALYGTEGLGVEHVLVGGSSTQLTHAIFTTLLDPGDRVVLFDPSYANYVPQLGLGPDAVEVVRLPVLDPRTWSWMADPGEVARTFRAVLDEHAPRILLFSSPNNPTGRIVPDALFFELIEAAADADCHVVVDFAYRAQCFVDPTPAHFAASPCVYPNLIRLHSNSKWCRGLGRRLGWVEADPAVIEALEVVQQATVLCPDTLHQHALAVYLERAVEDGSLRRYVADTNALYRAAAAHTADCIRGYLDLPLLEPEGGLYTVVDVGEDGDEFARRVLSDAGVVVVPGSGFGDSLGHAVRISYGPHVRDPDRIEQGIARIADAG